MTCWRIICGIALEMIEFGLHQQDNDKSFEIATDKDGAWQWLMMLVYNRLAHGDLHQLVMVKLNVFLVIILLMEA